MTIKVNTINKDIYVWDFCKRNREYSKKKYFNNFDDKNVCDNKKIWKVVYPLLSNKIISNGNITIVRIIKKYLTIHAKNILGVKRGSNFAFGPYINNISKREGVRLKRFHVII